MKTEEDFTLTRPITNSVTKRHILGSLKKKILKKVKSSCKICPM